MRLIAVGLAVCLVTGCPKKDDDDGTTAFQLGVLSLVEGLTVFAQRVPVEDSGTVIAPGQPNCWALSASLALLEACADQFVGAMVMTVDSGGGPMPFPGTASYSDLNFYSPELGEADGVTVAVIDSDPENVASGSYSAALTGTHDSSIRQALNLRFAAPPITLTYMVAIDASVGAIDGDSYLFAVEVRDSEGFLTVLYSETETTTTGTIGTYDLSGFVGEEIYLFFRQRSAAWNASWVDNVSVMDDDEVEYVLNGGFEAGSLLGWFTGSIDTVRNVSTGSVSVAGLDATRSFFSPAGAKWGRWVDTFSNDSGSTIEARISYFATLGASAYGIVYDTPDTMSGGAVTTWDGDDRPDQERVRDVGFVFGDPSLASFTSVTYISDTEMGDGAGSGTVVAQFDIEVGDGEIVTLVNFIVMNAVTTGDAAASAAAMATDIDTEALRIYEGYPMDSSVNEFTNGMTEEQIDAVVNF